MGKLKVFAIVFDGDNVGLFRIGDVVQGHVKIVLSEPKQDIRGLQIEWHGGAQTRWEETRRENDRDVTYVYGGEERYFEHIELLFGRGTNSQERLQLDVGEHMFPFRFQIPNAPLPHSFEGSCGFVRYAVKAIIDRPWKFNHTTVRLFTIVGVAIDLNTVPQAPMPSAGESAKTVCCLCCASGPIRVSANTNKSGYVPGETIWVSGTVDNNSRRRITKITIKLLQMVTFKAANRTKVEVKTLAYGEVEGCDRYSTASVDRNPFVVPSCPPSGLPGCGIINIEYCIQFAAGISQTPLDATVMLPIIIGTVPLASAQSITSPPGQVINQQPSAPSLTPDDLPPPSYELAMGGLQQIQSETGSDNTFGNVMYAPRYPYYNFPPPDKANSPPPS